MLRFIFFSFTFFLMTVTFAQMRPHTEIKCESPRISLNVEFKSCGQFLCKTTGMIDKKIPIETQVHVYLKAIPNQPNVGLQLLTEETDATKINFLGPFVRSGILNKNEKFVGTVTVQIPNLKVTQAMTCTMI